MTDPVAYIDDPFGGRSVKEWIGSSPDAKVPGRVRDRILKRADNRCYLSGIEIHDGDDWELEHVKALSLGGEHRERNLRPALVAPHKAKSSEEARLRKKADRIRRKLNKTWPETRFPLKSRGFAKRENSYR